MVRNRGSVWVKILGYLTSKSGLVIKSTRERVYGYSAVGQISSQNQRISLFNRALSKALATYRQHQNLDSDTEVNYSLLDDGIQYIDNKDNRLYWKQSRLTPAQKRQSHRVVTGKLKVLTQEDLANQYKRKEISVKPKNYKMYKNKKKSE